jgi:hypothetical protein
MRTKSLLLTAAVLAAGIAASNAQVYSANVVGYTTLNLVAGYNLVANQLDADGTGNNNTLNSVFGNNLPSSSQVFKFASGSFGTSDLYVTGPGWLSGGTMTLNPGEGVFVNCPSAATVTLVGQVLQGSLSTTIPAGYSIISSKVPQAGAIQSTLGYVPNNNDQIYQWNAAGQSYPGSVLYVTGPGWLGGEPTLAVGEACFINSASGGSWARSFTVN